MATALLAALLFPGAASGQPAAGLSEPERRELRRTPVVSVFDNCKDAVVNIASTQIIEVRSPFGFDRMFNDLFDLPAPGRGRTRQLRRQSVGSGFVIHPEGYIVTNAHVVARTAERKVVFPDGREFEAQVIAADARRDLAVLKIEADAPLPRLTLGTSGDLMIGETVIAIGNPLGYQHTVTAGVVSATDRTLQINDDLEFEDLIQTDASINPGNSGGPLLNALGELVGVNTAVRADAENIGFAIPVDQLRDLLPELLDVERRYRLRTGLTVKADRGNLALIDAVEPDSPASDAGLRVGRRIAAIDGEPVRGVIDYHIALIGKQPGDVLRLQTTDANGQVDRVALTLAERPRPDANRLLWDRFGLKAEPLTEKMARAMSIPRLRGLLITQVEPAGPADRIEAQRGDVIIAIDRHQPRDMDELGALIEQLEPNRPVRLGVIRVAGRSVYRLTANLEPRF